MKDNYIGSDGLLYCGVCHEPKQAFWEPGQASFGTDRHPRPCRCVREQREKEDRARREQTHRHRVAELRRNCFPYPAMERWTFSNAAQQTKQLEKGRLYAENWSTVSKQNAGLLFWGDVGTGKTYLAACIANALIEQEIPVRMTNLSTVINRGFEGREEYIRRLCSCPLLILDDLGTEMVTEFTKSALYTLINARLLSGRKTIISTNLTEGELERLYTPQICSRLRGEYQDLPFVGRDIRLTRKERGL